MNKYIGVIIDAIGGERVTLAIEHFAIFRLRSRRRRVRVMQRAVQYSIQFYD